MKPISVLLLVFWVVLFQKEETVQAQTVQILANNTLNGVINGVALGGASMLIADKKVNAPFTKNLDDLYALQVGFGLVTLYGVGMGAYDVVSGSGNDILLSGFFNDATNSSAIVLMDTFYGAAAGTLISLSITLLSENPQAKDIKTGAGVGAWVGFGFGLFDTFVLAKRSAAPSYVFNSKPQSASGIMALSVNENTSLGFINPKMITTTVLNADTFGVNQNVAVDLVNFRLNF